MGAPKFRPVPPTEFARAYRSPDHVPTGWTAERPGDVGGFQPRRPGLGSPGPDQGFALRIAERARQLLTQQPGAMVQDAEQAGTVDEQGRVAVSDEGQAVAGESPSSKYWPRRLPEKSKNICFTTLVWPYSEVILKY